MLAFSRCHGFNFKRRAISLTYGASTANVNLYTAAGSPKDPVDLIVTINSGVYLYGSTTSNYALDVASFAPGSRVRIVNNGYIAGKGGAGGSGGTAYAPGGGGAAGTAGGAGGPALRVQSMTGVIVEVDNTSGEINGGGGGGGAGSCVLYWDGVSGYSSGGGGGGGGRCGANSASPGAGGQASFGGWAYGTDGGTGTRSGAGTYGSGGLVLPGTQGGTGGAGGGWGAAGTAGANSGFGYTEIFGNSSGGAGGAAVVGNSNITWIANGTRNGSIS